MSSWQTVVEVIKSRFNQISRNIITLAAERDALKSRLALAESTIEKLRGTNAYCAGIGESLCAKYQKERILELEKELAAAKQHHELFKREAALGFERRLAAKEQEVERLKETLRTIATVDGRDFIAEKALPKKESE